jgi:hypothetical protein
MLVAASLLLGSPEPAKAGVSVGVGVSLGGFHNSLAAYGTWSNHPTYGSVWAPSHVAAGWRPYTVGHWDDGSGQLSWASDEPWGDTYHYGHWVFDPVLGWIWIPGTTWAPAWVTWRYGGGYVGWAPTPLYATAVVDPFHFCFVPQRYVTERVLARHFVPVQRNVTIVNVTRRTTVLPASAVPRRASSVALSRSTQQRSTIDSFRSTRERGLQASTEPSRSTQQQRSTIDSFRSTRERGHEASTEPSRSTQQRSTIDSFRSTRERGHQASTEPSRGTQQRSTVDSFRSSRERDLRASTEPSRSRQQRSSIDSFRSTRQAAWQRNDDRVRSTNSRPARSYPENQRTSLRGSQERPRTVAAPVHNSRPTTDKPAAQQRGASSKHGRR